MKVDNSYAEFVLGAFQAQLVDFACKYPELAKEFTRDFQRLSSAINRHGLWFALEVMPSFRKHLDKCLSERRLVPSGLLHFGAYERGGVIPRLFRGLTLRVFDRDGQLKDQADPVAILFLRQILGSFRKLRMEADVKHRGNAIRDFYRTDLSVRRGILTWDDHIVFAEEAEQNATSFTDAATADVPPCNDLFGDRPLDSNRELYGLLLTVQRVADLMCSKLGSFDPHDWKLRHGPGAVAGQVFGSYKYDFKRWPDRLEWVFPYAEFAIANFASRDNPSVDELCDRAFLHDIPAKLCAVPKTIQAPRLIACEPVYLQWCQQAVRDFMYSRIQKSVLANFIDFGRQDKNGSLALEASRSQLHSTIDLSSASDRISCWHVERLFRRAPSLLSSLQATRSVWITQDICKYSPRYHYLRKYSTMGNATTFPVQSLFFLALALGSVLYARNSKVSEAAIAALGDREVRVFGDDIIVPIDASGVLVELLEALSLRVNASKTFLNGEFKESCGIDAFRGNEVTAVSILECPRRTAPSSIVSTVDVHNNLLRAGYWYTAQYLRKTASRVGYTKVREVRYGDGAFGWYTFGVPSIGCFDTRWNVSLHRLEVKCLQPKATAMRLPAEGHPGLLQFFTEAAKKVSSASSTLGYLARRPKSRLTLRWASA